ncbi:54S ribosomal protein L23, mitochondrial [Dermatophagoides pteronyssinus]|uniref:Large ribosomal subunit protein uL23m n=1 Tax=Dermatophagoides pteronyssinus TaxID=6956 RepID=A0ABQ8JM46_DERPT|nr:54S ribosomal protein L23, mitochondrial [Dermatophagoides pteronyssinus]
MSTRWYPRYVRGNPQLRIFLPDFWMIIKKPEQPLPANKVMFKIPVQMTSFDVKNYLEKIYKIPVMHVKTRVVCGEIKKAKSAKPYLIKEDDYREAIVDLPKHVQFEYPDLYGGDRVKLEDEIGKLEKQFEFIKKREKRRMFAENRHNVPGWF